MEQIAKTSSRDATADGGTPGNAAPTEPTSIRLRACQTDAGVGVESEHSWVVGGRGVRLAARAVRAAAAASAPELLSRR
jgi:hypothetical protein